MSKKLMVEKSVCTTRLSEKYKIKVEKKMRKGLKQVLSTSAVLVGLMALTACANTQPDEKVAQDEPEAKKITVTHDYGETEVSQEPKNVVVFDLGVLDALDYMGVGDDVVGLPLSGTLPAHLSKYESEDYANAGSLKEPDLEAVYEMNPDLIIISGRQSAYYDELSEIAPTIYMGIDTEDYLASFEENMTVLGDIFNKEDVVENGLKEVSEKIEALNKEVTAQDLNALVVLTNEGSVSAYGANSRFGIIHNNFGFLEADNNLEEGSVHGSKVSFEYIKDINPDYLFVIDRGAVVGGEVDASGTLDNELINSTDAAKNGNIVYLDAAVWYTATGGFNSTLKMVDEVLEAVEK